MVGDQIQRKHNILNIITILLSASESEIVRERETDRAQFMHLACCVL